MFLTGKLKRREKEKVEYNSYYKTMVYLLYNAYKNKGEYREGDSYASIKVFNTEKERLKIPSRNTDIDIILSVSHMLRCLGIYEKIIAYTIYFKNHVEVDDKKIARMTGWLRRILGNRGLEQLYNASIKLEENSNIESYIIDGYEKNKNLLFYCDYNMAMIITKKKVGEKGWESYVAYAERLR